MKLRTDILERKEEILKWISEHQSKAYICKQLNCKPETLNSYLLKMGIDYAGNQGSKGLIRENSNYKTVEEYLKNNNIKSSILRDKLIKEKYKEYQCEICKNIKWMDELIPLELHHKNGKHYDNNLNNLQILCPNCHALQHKLTLQEPLKQKHYFCIDCGKEIGKSGVRCRSCAKKHLSTIEEKITREKLKSLIRKEPFTKIAIRYGISDNGIRKWCKHFDLPATKSEITQISDEDWKNI